MTLRIETEQETDGRWIAEVLDIPGALVYAQTRDAAIERAVTLAEAVIADCLEHGEAIHRPSRRDDADV